MPNRRVCEDQELFLPCKILFGMVVVLTAVMLVLTAAAYLVTVALLPPTPFEEQSQQTHRQ